MKRRLEMLVRLGRLTENIVFLRPEEPSWPGGQLGLGMLFPDDVQRVIAEGRVREDIAKLTEESATVVKKTLFLLLQTADKLVVMSPAEAIAKAKALGANDPHARLELQLSVVVPDALLRRCFSDLSN
jgi:hypothetical protein